MAASNGHIRKRQYQPSITSYFDRNADNTRSSRSPLSPPLPAETQASLLSVGMRVRKSVPEGYKTHKTIGPDGFPFPSTAPPASTAPVKPTLHYETSRELMPFCGLHKTGGWASQPQGYVPPSSAPAAVSTAEDDNNCVPGLSMSQQTLPSTQSSFQSVQIAEDGGNRKRTYEEEIEDDMDAFFDEVDAEEEMPTAAAPRRIAKPKSSLRRAATDGVLVAGGGGMGDDFEEAPFLSPMDVDDR